tara:strand:- start:707 stop:922 length:216 start_codon:yes stop_codon:yes gene_type:complete
MINTIDVLSSAQHLQQASETRLANAAHDLAKVGLSIEPPVEMMTAVHESSIATTLAEVADEMHGHTLDLLA